MDRSDVQADEVGAQKIPNIRKLAPVIILMLLAAAILLPNLGKGLFWQDEAETALLARSIVKNGLPYVWDGRNIVTQLNGNESTPSGLWTFTPWVPFYITSASFKILGESEFSGRLPFAIIGILSIIPCYLLGFRLTGSRKIAFLSALFLVLNMQFILYSRQCKYYSLSFFLAPTLSLLLLDLDKGWRRMACFIFAGLLFFYTNYVSFFLLFCGFSVYMLMKLRRTALFKKFVLACIVIGFLTAPLFFASNIAASAGEVTGFPTFKSLADKFSRIVWHFNNMVFPLILFIPLAMNKTFRTSIRYLATLALVSWCALTLLNQDVFRYNLGLVPIFCVILAMITAEAWRQKRYFGTALLLLLLATNILSKFPWTITKLIAVAADFKFSRLTPLAVKMFNKKPERVGNYFFKIDYSLTRLNLKTLIETDIFKTEYIAYYNEITKPYNEPSAYIINFLKERASPEDVVATNFGQLSIAYYTSFKTGNVIGKDMLAKPKDFALPSYLFSLDEAKWFIPRSISMPKGPFITEPDLINYFKNNGLKYKVHDTGINEIYWDSKWPQHFDQYKNKFYFHNKWTEETIKIYEIFR